MPLPGITISRFENGKIAEDCTVSDNLELLRLLGHLWIRSSCCSASSSGF